MSPARASTGRRTPTTKRAAKAALPAKGAKKAPAKAATKAAEKAAQTTPAVRVSAPKPVAPKPPPEIRHTVEIQAPPFRVWAAITSPDEINRWFTERCEFEARRGGRVLYYWSSREPADRPEYVEKSRFGTAAEARIESWEPPRMFSLRPMSLWPGLVTFRLEPVPLGTRVTVEHTGWQARDTWFKAHEGAWSDVMDFLKNYLEKPEAEYDAYLARKEGTAAAR